LNYLLTNCEGYTVNSEGQAFHKLKSKTHVRYLKNINKYAHEIKIIIKYWNCKGLSH